MRKEMTYKSVKENFPHCFSCSYCSLQHLLKWSNPIGYHTSIYGWDCDFYDLYPVVIATGYRTRGMKQIDSDMLANYDNRAVAVIDSKPEYEDQKHALGLLIEELVQGLLK